MFKRKVETCHYHYIIPRSLSMNYFKLDSMICFWWYQNNAKNDLNRWKFILAIKHYLTLPNKVRYTFDEFLQSPPITDYICTWIVISVSEKRTLTCCRWRNDCSKMTRTCSTNMALWSIFLKRSFNSVRKKNATP